MESTQSREVKAARTFLSRMGYEILSTGWASADGDRADVVARDGKYVVFVEVAVKGETEQRADRGTREDAAVSWLASKGCDLVDVPVRFDEILFIPISEDRALIRHFIDAPIEG